MRIRGRAVKQRPCVARIEQNRVRKVILLCQPDCRIEAESSQKLLIAICICQPGDRVLVSGSHATNIDRVSRLRRIDTAVKILLRQIPCLPQCAGRTVARVWIAGVDKCQKCRLPVRPCHMRPGPDGDNAFIADDRSETERAVGTDTRTALRIGILPRRVVKRDIRGADSRRDRQRPVNRQVAGL